MLEIKEEFGIEDKIPTEPQKIMDEFAIWLHKVQKPTIIIFDGYNQIEDEMKEKLFYYLPDKLENIKLIITSIKDNYDIKSKHKIEALKIAEQKELVESYLSYYGKTLESDTIGKIVSHPQTNNTLFLKTLLDEIRLLGNFENLHNDIDDYLRANDVIALFTKIFKRLENDYRPNLAKEILSLLYVSRDGLSEDNLMEILNQTSNITRLEFSPLFLAIEEHLIDRGGLYGFFHGFIEEAVANRYLNSDKLVNVERKKIADYFEVREIDNQRIRELPFQLFELEDRDGLYDCLIDVEFFIKLIDYQDRDLEYEALKYLRFIENKLHISQDIYAQILNSNSVYQVSRVAIFLSNIYIKYDEALPLFQKSLQMQIDIFGEEHIKTSQSYLNLGEFYSTIGEFNKAVTVEEKSIEIRERNLGIDNIETLEAYISLVDTYGKLGKHDKAIMIGEKSLNIAKNILNLKDKNMIRLHQVLASTYAYQENYTKALYFYKKVLNITKLINKDTRLSSLYNSISDLYREMKEYKKALYYSTRSLRLSKKLLGSNHFFLSAIYNNIGNIYEEQNNHTKALSFHKKALSLTIKTIGEEYPDTAQSYNNIAVIYSSLEKYDISLEYHEKALTIREDKLGLNHPDTFNSYINIANTYQLSKQYEQSLFFLEKALSLTIEAFGLQHVKTADTYNNIAFVNQNIGEYEKAIFFYLKDLEISEKETPDNSQLINTYRNMVQCYQELPNYQEALFYSKKCLAIEEETLVVNDVNILISYHDIGLFSFLIGNYNDAVRYLNKYLNLYLLSEESLEIETMNALNHIGVAYFKLENYQEANKYYKELLKLAYEIQNDQFISVTYSNIAKLYVAQNKYQEALPLYQKSIEMEEIFDNPNPKVYLNYADLLNQIEDLNSAKENYMKAIEIIESQFDNNHPDLIEAKSSLEKVNKKLNSL